MPQYRNVRAHIRPEAIPEYWLVRQQEAADAGFGGADGDGELTAEEARQLLAVDGEAEQGEG